MATARRQRGPKVEVPKAGDAPLRLGRIGIIAVVGFVIGIAWPRLAGVQLVPEVPGAPASSQDLSGAPPEAPAASAAPALPKPAETQEVPARKSQPSVVGEAQVTSCRDAGGGRIEKCDNVDFDRVARSRLSTLDDCEGAREATGIASIGFDLDFTTERVTRVSSGKTTKLDDDVLKSLLDCIEEKFSSVSLVGIPHEHQRYTVFYRMELKGAVEAAPAGSSEPVSITPASGAATVTWDTALVHATPGRETKVVARLRAGTRVGVTGRSGDWYRVKYDARGREGWVFRTAIGL
jgi:hypothetical protein